MNERKWKRNSLCKKSFFVTLTLEKDCTRLAKIWFRRWKNTSAYHGLIFNFAHKSEVMDYPHPLNTTYIRSWWTNARWWQYFKYCSNPKIHYYLFLFRCYQFNQKIVPLSSLYLNTYVTNETSFRHEIWRLRIVRTLS